MEKVIGYLVENGIADGLHEIDNGMECVPTDVMDEYDKLDMVDYYWCIEEAVKKLKEKVGI